MKAIPMRGKLTGKRVRGYLWAGRGQTWQKKENYFQLEHSSKVSAVMATSSGSFTIRCYGATCKILLKDAKGHVLSTAILALPRGRKN